MKPDKKVTLLISDTHIGCGEGDPFEDHVWQGQPLARLLDQLGASEEGRRGELEMIINGDFLEFVQAAPEYYTAVAADLWCSEAESVGKLAAIVAGNQPIFSALRRFQDSGNRVTLMAGNHDVDFYWPKVQETLRQVAGPVEFELGEEWYSRYGGRLAISHGHQLDPANSFRHWADPVRFDAGTPRLEMCDGTRFMLGFVNPMEGRFPFVDNIKPLSRLVTILRREDVPGFSWAAWQLVRYLTTNAGTMLGTSSSGGRQPAQLLRSSDEFAAALLPLFQQLRDPKASRESLRAALARASDFEAFLEEVLRKGRGLELPALPGGATLSSEGGKGTLGLAKERMTDGVQDLRDAAAKKAGEGAQVIVCGHTHSPDEIRRSRYVYFNTGSWTRYLLAEKEEGLRLADLKDESRYPYELSYVRVEAGEGDRLRASKIIFEKSSERS